MKRLKFLSVQFLALIFMGCIQPNSSLPSTINFYSGKTTLTVDVILPNSKSLPDSAKPNSSARAINVATATIIEADFTLTLPNGTLLTQSWKPGQSTTLVWQIESQGRYILSITQKDSYGNSNYSSQPFDVAGQPLIVSVTLGDYVTISLNDNPYSYFGEWDFSDNAYDSSGNSQNGIVQNVASTRDRFGRTDSAFAFNGSSYVLLPPAGTSGVFGGDFYISFWEQSSSTSRMYAFSLESNTSAGSNNNLNIEFNDTIGVWAYWNSGGSNMIRAGGVGEYTDGLWHNVILSRTGTTMCLYMDGALVGTTSCESDQIGDLVSQMMIGGDPLYNFFWTGKLDDVRIAPHGVSNQEIALLSSAIEPRSPKPLENWSAGSTHSISWQLFPGQQTDGLATIDYSLDGGVTWTNVATNTTPELHNGAYYYWWTVPLSISNTAQVRVTVNVSGSPTVIQSHNFSITSANQNDYSWKIGILIGASFIPRDGAGMLVFNNQLMLIGGWNPNILPGQYSSNGTLNDVWSSSDAIIWNNIKADTFLTSSFNPATDWEGRHTAGYGVLGNQMYIWGGDPLQGHYQYDVWRSPDGSSWSQLTNSVPWGPRFLFNSAVFDNLLWVFGGQTLDQMILSTDPDKGKNIIYGPTDTWNSPDGVTWTKVGIAVDGFQPRGGQMGVVSFNNRLWIIGGGVYDSVIDKATVSNPDDWYGPLIGSDGITRYRELLNDVWSSADGINWNQQVERAPWSPRMYHSVAVYDNKLWVIDGNGWTGNGLDNFNDSWYSSDGVNWYPVSASSESAMDARHAASIAPFNNKLYLIAGSIDGSFPTNQVLYLSSP